MSDRNHYYHGNHINSRFNNLGTKNINDLEKITWVTNPISLPYVRQSHYTICIDDVENQESSKQFLKRFLKDGGPQFGMLVGFEMFNYSELEDNKIACGDYYYLKKHDTYFHPNHKCCESYCVNGWYPSEAVAIIGEYDEDITYCKRKSVGSLRHLVFFRDNYKCVECGASNKDSILHIDHIIPVSKGGDNIESNLQTLCKECNLAKRDTIWDQKLTKE